MNKKAPWDNVIRIPSSIDGNLFRYWLEFLRPFHKLTDREIQILSVFLKYRFKLSEVISDEELLDKVVMGEEYRKKLIKECNITTSHYQVVMGKLRKAGTIVDGKINKRFIPNLKRDGDSLKLMLYFDLNAKNS